MEERSLTEEGTLRHTSCCCACHENTQYPRPTCCDRQGAMTCRRSRHDAVGSCGFAPQSPPPKPKAAPSHTEAAGKSPGPAMDLPAMMPPSDARESELGAASSCHPRHSKAEEVVGGSKPPNAVLTRQPTVCRRPPAPPLGERRSLRPCRRPHGTRPALPEVGVVIVQREATAQRRSTPLGSRRDRALATSSGDGDAFLVPRASRNLPRRN